MYRHTLADRDVYFEGGENQDRQKRKHFDVQCSDLSLNFHEFHEKLVYKLVN